MTAAPKRRPPTHDEAVTFAVAASGLAGHDVSPEALDLLARIGRGELTHDEAIAEIIAEFSEPTE
ncbi:antitoxin VbhA family protein [Mycolicibacterium thermoresistibile]